MNPELTPFLDTWNQRWSRLKPRATPAERRAHFEIIAKEMRLPTPEDVDGDAVHWIERVAHPVRVRVFRHKSDNIQPCLVYMHGGAWMQGSPETHWDITSRIASWNQQTVISIDYAKAPETPFPVAIDQCGDVVRWVFDNAEMLKVDPARIAVGGDSAGGNLSAALCHDLKGEIPLCAQLLIYPACDFDQSRPSYLENPDGPIVRVKDMDAVNAMYCPNPADLVNPRAAPLFSESFDNLPPAFIAVAEFDPLRDSGIAYAERLDDVEVDLGEGLIHGYLRAMGYCQDSEAKLRKMAAWLKTKNSA